MNTTFVAREGCTLLFVIHQRLRYIHVGWEFAALARLAARCPVWCRGLPAS